MYILSMRTTNIIIAEDHELFQKGIAYLIQNMNGVNVVGVAGDGQAAIRLTKELRVDLALVDVEMPGVNGFDACQKISIVSPKTRVIAISHNCDESTLLNMVSAGAKGFILKSGAVSELEEAIRQVNQGGTYFSKSLSGMLLSGLSASKRTDNIAKPYCPSLTNREAEILKFIADEWTNQEIADQLFISPRTVETHKRNIIQKLKVRNTVGLVKYYLRSSNQLKTVGR